MIKIEQNSKMYPNKLTKIQSKPKQLYIEGNLQLLNSIGIAVIEALRSGGKDETTEETD